MSEIKMIIVHLRRPNKDRLDEKRSDPFWEFGSFGCTGCHGKNLMNPKKSHLLNGVHLAFAQGGKNGFRLIFVTPPINVINYSKRCEARWKPRQMPFKYADAPVLVWNTGDSDVPALVDLIRDTAPPTLERKFSSMFRTRRRPINSNLAEKILRVYNSHRSKGGKSKIAKNYIDALPYPPNTPDTNRRQTYETLKSETKGCKKQNGC